MQYLLYLHGFHSSPYSEKALLFTKHVKAHYPNIDVIAPQLPTKPKQVLEVLNELISKYDFQGVIGSSLGGFLATYLHNKIEKPIVLVNPAVKPFELLHDYLGPQTHPITSEQYELTEQDMTELKQLYQPELKARSQIWLLQQEKDEVLDYREALEKYQGCKISFELGGDHSFVGFDRYLTQIVEFFDLGKR